jgi:hypothetical protein
MSVDGPMTSSTSVEMARLTNAAAHDTQPDLQREFYRARQNTPQPYRLPALCTSGAIADLSGIRYELAATNVISWRCTGVSSPMKGSAGGYNVSIGAFSALPINSSRSLKPKNEETLAGQSAELHEFLPA